MTESRWLKTDKPREMLNLLGETASPRKLRLAACAWLRTRWEDLQDSRSRAAVLAGERFADGQCSLTDLRAAGRAAAEACSSPGPPGPGAESRMLVRLVARNVAYAYVPPIMDMKTANFDYIMAFYAARDPLQSVILRDLFGNPFRPAAFDPSWRTPRVVRLAEAIYRERAFDELPVLADLLEEEAVVTDAQLLGHFRSAGPHWLGCHGLDAVLDKG